MKRTSVVGAVVMGFVTGTGTGSMSLKAPGAVTWWSAPYAGYERSHSATVYKQGAWAVDASDLNYSRTYGSCRS